MDNVAIITGASGTLGSAVRDELLIRGDHVVGLCRTDPRTLDVEWCKTDLSSNSSIANALDYVKMCHPKFDYLINCAGVFNLSPIDELDYREMENLFRVNLMAPMKIMSGLMELIKKNEADVVNVGSSISYKAYEDHSMYGASKWGLRGFTKHVQLELENTKSRVMYFSPAGFKSKLFEKVEDKMDTSNYMDAKDLAKLLVHLLYLPKNMEVSDILINRNDK